MRSTERRELRDTISKLVAELETMKTSNAHITVSRSEVERELHASKLELIAAKDDAEVARHESAELRTRLSEVEAYCDRLNQVLELRVAAQKRRQRAAREMLDWAETRSRTSIEESRVEFIAAVTPLLAVSAQGKHERRGKSLSSEMTMLSAMERLRRADIYSHESRALQQLAEQWTHLAQVAFDSYRRQAATPHRNVPRSASVSTADTSRRQSSPSTGARPWYPPGPTHATPPQPSRRGRSPSLGTSSGSRCRTPPAHLRSTVASMHSLLAQLSSWSEGHSP
jgi:hypothetical protein